MDLYNLGAKSVVKYTGLYSLGAKSAAKYTVLYNSVSKVPKNIRNHVSSVPEVS